MNARYYDPLLGTFVSPDTIVPQPGLASDYNRYLAFRGNPMKYVDPSGHETSKPDWWPPSVPYPFDLPDDMTHDEFIEWMSENNVPTTWGVTAGIGANLVPFVGTSGSAEFNYLFNWLTGETVLASTSSVGVSGGTPDVSVGVYAGAIYVVGASSIEQSVLGYSRYSTGQVDVEALGQEATLGLTRGRALASDALTAEDYIDPQFNRTVDSIALNVGAGEDAVTFPAQPVPLDMDITTGHSETRGVFSFNLYSPFRAVWNFLTGK